MYGVIKEKQRIRVDSAGVFLLGAVFLFLSIGLVMLGGSLYRHIMLSSGVNDQIRTTFSYIANQVRRADANGGVEVGEWKGQEALLLTQDFGGWAYVTYLYHYDGALRELFVEKGTDLDPEAGLPIVWLEGISFLQDDQGMITVRADFEDGRIEHMFLSPKTSATEEGR
ncbi:MAG: DUF4860 domain-containing protein [Clostridiales bacterium]|nr:DUF4860 domain-containing protein [Clostridiales bacterium]